MSQHIKVEESYVDALLENAAWGAARVSLDEKRGDKKGDKGAGKDKTDKPDYTTDARKGDKGKGKKKGDKPDYTTDQRKGDKSKTHPGRSDFEEMKEGTQPHTCPLCESVLEEALTDEQIQEHVFQIQSALESIEEAEEVEEQEQGATVGRGVVMHGEDDGDRGAPQSRKSKVQAKVKELKAASQK